VRKMGANFSRESQRLFKDGPSTRLCGLDPIPRKSNMGANYVHNSTGRSLYYHR